MVDNFSHLLAHLLLMVAFWRLTQRDDLDPPSAAPPFQKGAP